MRNFRAVTTGVVVFDVFVADISGTNLRFHAPALSLVKVESIAVTDTHAPCSFVRVLPAVVAVEAHVITYNGGVDTEVVPLSRVFKPVSHFGLRGEQAYAPPVGNVIWGISHRHIEAPVRPQFNLHTKVGAQGGVSQQVGLDGDKTLFAWHGYIRHRQDKIELR